MRLHVVDGTFELFRAHHSPRPGRSDRHGRDVKASVGVVEAVLALLEDPDEAVTHVAVAFDNPIESFRNDLFAGYKDSSGVPEELLAQFDLVEVGVRALGVTVWSMDRYEADDALASAAARWAEEVEQVRILTPDKDLGQAVVGTRVVQVDRMRGREFDADGVRDRLGVAPPLVPDLLALVGDTADGIPGLPGFGAKTAAALLNAFGHLEEIPVDPARWPVRGAPRLATTLADRREDALAYRHLATLVTDVDLDGDLDTLRWRGARTDAFLAWCDEVDASTLAGQRARWQGRTS